MFRLIILCLLLCAFFNTAAQAQRRDQELSAEEEYQKAGEIDAASLRQKFEKAEKPKYQQAYDDYIKDLKLINIFGQARDNQALYDDLGAMNSNEKIIYSRNKPDKRPIYKPVY